MIISAHTLFSASLYYPPPMSAARRSFDSLIVNSYALGPHSDPGHDRSIIYIVLLTTSTHIETSYLLLINGISAVL